MREHTDDDRLASLVATPLRIGVGLAVAFVAAGLGLRWLGGPSPAADHAPLLETILGGGAPAVTSLGLLLLTLVPLAVAIGATIGFWRTRERRYFVGSAVVTGLLVVSLVLSWVILTPST